MIKQKSISLIKISQKTYSKIKDNKLIKSNNSKTTESKMLEKPQTKKGSTTKVGDTKNDINSKTFVKK